LVWPSGYEAKFFKRRHLRSTATLRFTHSKKPIGGHVNPIGPRSCYDEGKRCAETLFFDYGRQHKLKIKVLRIFNTYGPRMQPNDGRVVSNFIVQALNNQPLTIYGDGLQTRSFCFVDDLVRGMIGLMNSPDSISGPINCGNPNEFTIRDLAEKVIAMTGSGSRIVHRPLPQDDPRQRRPDISQAQELLNWRPTVMLTEGLERTIAYFEKLHSKSRNRARENRSTARPRSSPRSKIRELAQNGDAASQEAVTSTSCDGSTYIERLPRSMMGAARSGGSVI
jgi:nucleoside-diphosphate-sugar epimerase